MTHDTHPLAATRADLYELYRLLVGACLDYLRDRPADKLRGSMLDVVRKLLVDAGITAEVRDAINAKRALEALKEQMDGNLESFVAPFPAKLTQ